MNEENKNASKTNNMGLAIALGAALVLFLESLSLPVLAWV